MVGGPRIPCAGNSTSKLPNSCAAHTPVDQSIKARHASEASPLGPHTTSEASPLGPQTRFRLNILPYTSEASQTCPRNPKSGLLTELRCSLENQFGDRNEVPEALRDRTELEPLFSIQNRQKALLLLGIIPLLCRKKGLQFCSI